MSENNWRFFGVVRREVVAGAIFRRSKDRLEYGMGKHGPALVGDPLDHLDEELTDAQHYAAWARAQRHALCERIAELEALLGQHDIPIPGWDP